MKQIMVVRKDLNMSPGKVAAQCCHASLMSYIAAAKHHADDVATWWLEGQTKVIVMVDTEEELVELHNKIKSDKQLAKRNYLVRDAGHTELKGQNLTVLGIGPCSAESVDQYTRKLKLYR